ncbi:hypothetical protein [Elioraea sp.]|nr:hypothetical protein [Elioraea sp.]
MTTLALWLVTALYLAQAIIEAARGNAPAAMILAGYIIANTGLIWSLRP